MHGLCHASTPPTRLLTLTALWEGVQGNMKETRSRGRHVRKGKESQRAGKAIKGEGIKEGRTRQGKI